ncbi:DNA repair protein [bacterium]|nr:DNA repair protein [bacterium]MDY2886254.1 DNA repair protein [Bariatricus sp.]
MTDKELRKLSRAELLEMLIQQIERNEELEAELKKVKTGLRNRAITIENAGSLAEAALQINGVFEAADRAAKQYLRNVQRMAEKGSRKE